MKIAHIFGVLVLTSTVTLAQRVPVIKLPELEDLMGKRTKEIMVINFWATWCAPCVKELPLFEQLHQTNQRIDVLLVSMDFADKADRVDSFLNRKRIKAKTVLLDEIDYNSWIDRVDKDWQGAIPATLFINTTTGKRKFVAKELTQSEIEDIIKQLQQS